MAFKQKKRPAFLVWNQDSGETHKVHWKIDFAEREAQRLANNNPGKKFHVLASLGYCTADKADCKNDI